jgi:hypothetical protein
MVYPVTMELPNHPARLRQSGHVFLNTKRRGLGRLRSTTLLCLGSFQEVRMCEGGPQTFMVLLHICMDLDDKARQRMI